METMAKHYSFTQSVTLLCKTGPAFLEPLDDNKAIADETIDANEEEDVVVDEGNTLMLFDDGEDKV